METEEPDKDSPWPRLGEAEGRLMMPDTEVQAELDGIVSAAQKSAKEKRDKNRGRQKAKK